MKKYMWNSICSDRDKCRVELIQIKRSGQNLSHSLEVTGASISVGIHQIQSVSISLPILK